MTDKVEKKLQDVVKPVDLFAMDPTELAEQPESIEQIIQYYRDIREIIRDAERMGKRITSKTVSRGKGPTADEIMASLTK